VLRDAAAGWRAAPVDPAAGRQLDGAGTCLDVQPAVCLLPRMRLTASSPAAAPHGCGSIGRPGAMKANPVGWFEIYVRDMPRAKAFYEAVFGVVLDKQEKIGPGLREMWTFPMAKDASGAAGALALMDGGGPEGNAVLVYFSCEDCAQEACRVAANGGRVMKEKFAAGDYGYIAIVVDTEGNAIGLHSFK
jgi:predicted enzyme related to lactoylglutathione lyase